MRVLSDEEMDLVAGGLTVLSESQKKVETAIVSYGRNHGYDKNTIQGVVQMAFKESSLGAITQNPNSSATGVFQYMPSTFAQVAPGKDINSLGDQISTAYWEFDTYAPSFIQHVNSGDQNYANFTAVDYVDAVHHWHLGAGNFDPTLSELNGAKVDMDSAKAVLGDLQIYTRQQITAYLAGDGGSNGVNGMTAYTPNNNIGGFWSTRVVVTYGNADYTAPDGSHWTIVK